MQLLRSIAVMAAVCSFAAAAEKQLKPGESEAYNDVVKDLSGANFTKALIDLDTWRQKFPDSDFRDDRSALYIQTYAGLNQPAKVLDTASELITKGLETIFPAPAGQPTVIRVLYNAVWAISQMPNPSPDQVATGGKAAHQLLDYDQALPGVAADKWAEVRADMREKAGAALLYIAMLPGIQAMAKQPPDCSAAEPIYTKALADYPDKAVLSYELGRALSCESKTAPEKQAPAVYEFLRAAVIDASLGNPKNDRKKIQAFADNAYVRLHGSDEGLEQLKQQVKQSALPPAGFQIETASQIAEAAQKKFENDNPQLALWLRIKAKLSDTNGEEYFQTQLKDAAVPQLKGMLIEAKPACRPKELLVAVPVPDAQQTPQPEITLKLDKPLSGKPEVHGDIYWEGVPSAFTRDPFMLTMDTETGKVQGLKTTPCPPSAPARRKTR
ncbi:MAG TPA: hypothetical protein VG297_11800 [Bryobacteraceae bacterium]|nr:hypothetical protein [Bryobacteraceae bacterium]